MFEDSTFASTGRIRMRSRAGFFAATVLETSILLAMVLIPLFYPQALPNMVRSILMEAPATHMRELKAQSRPANARAVPATVMMTSIEAPRKIPKTIFYPDKPEAPSSFNPGEMLSDSRAGSGDNPFGKTAPVTVVRAAPKRAVRLSSSVVEGMLVHKTIPVYPQIAIAAHMQGTVELQATISRSGTIENLRVVNGPPMLQQAALDAVHTWRYRPYMLNGEPIEVETTVNVVFRLD